MDLDERQLEMSESRPSDFSDLNALFLNCTLKRLPELSHTEGLVRIGSRIKPSLQERWVNAQLLNPPQRSPLRSE